MSEKSLIVAVRVRPLLETELQRDVRATKNILRVMDSRMVVVLDPDESKGYLDQRANRSKEKKYTFDQVFDTTATTRTIYDGTIREVVSGVINGLNGTVFAYGATGSGKTYTMVGSEDDPGLMVLSLEQIFAEKNSRESLDVTCSYLEVYNEAIYDLLVKRSSPLELREDPSQGVQIAGLTRITVHSVDQIIELLQDGNKRRKTDSTSANATSSRSHAVLEVVVRRSTADHYRRNELRGKLCLVDLAGSERAAETDNAGQKLRDGANINRSLLALANCINALGKRRKQGMAYVPYRNSKLTRLLKDGLSGNSATAMIATVAASSDQYHHSINTLKYADRAKEIRTRVVANISTVESHVSDYRRIIDNLQTEVLALKSKLEEKPSNGSVVDDQLSWIDDLASEINDNVEERINLQKALFELEDVNVCNKFELKNLNEYLSTADFNSDEENELNERKESILENVKENEETGRRYRHEIDENERCRFQIQQRIEQAMEQYQSASFLKILSTFRLQAVRLQEFQFQMAIRDQIISEQRNVIKNLWNVMEYSGLDKEAIIEIAQNEGIRMETYLDTDTRVPSVGASDLLTLLNTEKLGQREIQRKKSITAETPKTTSHDDSFSNSSRETPSKLPSPMHQERKNDADPFSDQSKRSLGSQTNRFERRRDSLVLHGLSLIPDPAQPQQDRQPSVDSRSRKKDDANDMNKNALNSDRSERDRERRRVQINLLKSLARNDPTKAKTTPRS